jgi:hypothetical protein
MWLTAATIQFSLGDQQRAWLKERNCQDRNDCTKRNKSYDVAIRETRRIAAPHVVDSGARLGGDPPVGSSTAFKDARTHLVHHDRHHFYNLRQHERLVAVQEKPPTPQSFDEIKRFILAQIDACRIGARSIGVGAMEVEHTGVFGRDRHRKCFARSEIGDNCLW